MKKIHFSLLALVALVLFSCKKYEDGGTYKSGEKHLTNTWTLSRVDKNGLEILNKCGITAEDNSVWCGQILSFSEDGVGSSIFEDSLGVDQPSTFSWEFRDKKSKIYISFYNTLNLADNWSSDEFIIRRLSKSGFIIENTLNNGTKYTLSFSK